MCSMDNTDEMEKMNEELRYMAKHPAWGAACSWLKLQEIEPAPEPGAVGVMGLHIEDTLDDEPYMLLALANVGIIVCWKRNCHTVPLDPYPTQRWRAQNRWLIDFSSKLADENTKIISDIPKE